MELHLLNASMASRDSLFLILDYINQKDYTKEFVIIINKIKEYYQRDADVKSVNREIFVNLLGESITNAKHLDRFTTLIDQALMMDTSVNNINKLIVDTKKHEVGLRLATALANKEDEKVATLMEEYNRLDVITSIEELEGDVEIYTAEDISTIIEGELSGESRLKVYPLVLNERLNGRASEGHHIIHFARPEMGKTALNITMSGGFARQGAKGIYALNEDRTEDVYLREISFLTGLTYKEILMDPKRAENIARARGLENITFISLAPGNARQIERYVDRLQPQWVIIDQLRNLDMKEQNKVLQLEKAAIAIRTLAKKYGFLAISTTQAGDSAEGKRLLGMGDIDFSNTGIPSQADTLIGMGGTPEDVEKGTRFFNLPKNKIGGRHESFAVQLIQPLNRFVSPNQQGEQP